MRYEYKSEDVFDFLKANSIEYRIRGDEIEAKHCPYCRGADKYTFSINAKTGAFNCFRASCGKHGHFVELCRDFDYPLVENTTFRALPQPKQQDIVIRDTAVE